jgi:hypothetical protein
VSDYGISDKESQIPRITFLRVYESPPPPVPMLVCLEIGRRLLIPNGQYLALIGWKVPYSACTVYYSRLPFPEPLRVLLRFA